MINTVQYQCIDWWLIWYTFGPYTIQFWYNLVDEMWPIFLQHVLNNTVLEEKKHLKINQIIFYFVNQ